MRRNHLAIDRALTLDLLDAREEHGSAITRDVRLVRSAVRSQRHVALSREDVHVAAGLARVSSSDASIRTYVTGTPRRRAASTVAARFLAMRFVASTTTR